MLHLHRAERADVLADGLARLLAEPPADAFERDVVVVAAKGVERWLAQTVSHRLGTGAGREDGICAGVEFVRPAHLVAELTEKDLDDPWSPGRLAWTVLDVIDVCIDEEWLGVVARHVGHGMPPADEALRRSRRYTTARRTASLLHGYALQRPRMVRAWTDGDDVDGQGNALSDECLWQAEVWRRVAVRLDGQPSPDVRLAGTADALRAGTLAPDLPQRLSFVGHTRMPAAELDVVAALAEQRDVHLWVPHPSRRRWDAVVATRHEGPVARDDVEVPEVGNALLTSCGRDVTELEQALLALPTDAVVEHLPAPERPATLLGLLQADVAADRDGAGDDGADGERTLDPADRSVQVHACHGPARQVDVLREVVVGLLADDPTLEPRDVLVMCPDVETFAPLIHAAFGLEDVDAVDHPGHRLRVRLADRATGSINPVADVLQRVVAIAAGGRTTATEVRDLLGTAPVRRRFGLSDDDLEQLDTWTTDTAVRWGLDADARDTWGLGGLAQNTWRSGLDRLALGVAADPTGHSLGGVLPVDDLASTEVDLVGRFSETLARLGAVLTDADRPQPLSSWIEVLSRAVGLLTESSRADAWHGDQVLRILADLASDQPGGGGDLTVVEIGAVLDDAFAARPTRANFRTGSLTVCTMVPMRSVPHRVVCLLGLDADVFPRTPTPLGDDVLARHPLVGERDAAGEDRQLFLDAVLSATEHLVITHTGASEHTGRPLPPATPVGELLDQLERTVPGARVREHVVVHHPLQSFDARSFTPDALVPGRAFSFDPAGFAGARAVQRPARPPEPFLATPLPAPSDDVVSLEDLRGFVAHPVRAFLRQRLDVTTTYESDPPEDGIPLSLDALERWGVGERVLAAVLAGASGPDAEAAERHRGLLPPGVLGDTVLAGVRDLVLPLVTGSAELRSEPATSVDVDVALADGRRVVGTVDGLHPGHGLRLTTSRVTGKRLLQPWVDVLVLAAARPTGAVPFHLVGRVPGQGYSWVPGVRTLTPPAPEDAVGLLTDLVDLWTAGMTAPLALPVKTSQVQADWLRKQKPQIAAARAEQEWLGNRDKNIDGEDVDPFHVIAFGAGTPFTRLEELGLSRHAMRLWTPLLDRLREGR